MLFCTLQLPHRRVYLVWQVLQEAPHLAAPRRCPLQIGGDPREREKEVSEERSDAEDHEVQ